MRTTMILLAAVAAGFANAAPAADEPELQPGLRIEIPFGGPARPQADARFAARLDYGGTALPSGMAPLLQWQVTPTRSSLELYGVALRHGPGYVLSQNGGAAPEDKAGTIVAWSVGSTLLIGGLAVLAVTEIFGGFGEAMAQTTVNTMAGGDGSSDSSEPECTGNVQVGDDCLAGG